MPLASVRRRACFVVWIERLLARLWPLALAFTAAFLIALSGALALLPALLHLAILCAVAAALVAWVWRQARTVTPPSLAEADRRVEQASGLPHQPYAVLGDHPAVGAEDAKTSRFWRLHREQAQIALTRRQRAGWPRWPQALLHSLPMLGAVLLAAILWTGEQTVPRLAASLSPDVRIVGLTVAPPVTAWLEPPAYTGQPTQSLPLTPETPITIPVGTTLRVLVRDSWLAPRLSHGAAAERLETLPHANSTFALARPLMFSGEYRLHVGVLTAARWPFKVLADMPPEIALGETPQPNPEGTLRIGYAARDDYGVVAIRAVVQQTAPPDGSPIADAQPVRVEIVRAAQESRQPALAGTVDLDLTAHPWAGLPVTLQLEAVDASGQTRLTPPVALTLPERRFTHPVARQLARLRKQALRNFAMVADAAAGQLAEILSLPQTLDGDLTAYLAVRAAFLRLLQATGAPEVPPSVPPLLWETALRLENRTPAGADTRLRQAEAALQQALDNPGSTAQEIQQALNELTEALQDYLDQMQDRAAFMPPDARSAMTETASENLGEMLRALLQSAGSGDRQQAQQALDSLRQLTDALRTAQAHPERSRQTLQALEDLAKLAGDQTDLAEAASSGTAQDAPALAKQQAALGKRLQDVQKQFRDAGLAAPPALAQAGQLMEDAETALSAGKQAEGAQQATAAADALSGSLNQTLQSLQQGGMRFLSLGQPGGSSGRAATSGLKVPDDPRTRLREILETLRTRANDPARPPEEREYLRRLLDVF